METVKIEDFNTFSSYIDNNNNDFINDLHVLYLVTSPIHIDRMTLNNKKNDAIVNVIVLVKNKYKYSFKELQFNWLSIDLLKTYTYISFDSSARYLGELNNYKLLFKRENNVTVKLSTVKEITLTEVIEKYKYYDKLPPKLVEKYSEERFLVFKVGKKEFIISCIEVVRYFYCFSFGDSLKQAIFHPSGLFHLVKCFYEKKKHTYDLYLNSLCEMNDSQKIFYFLREDIYKEFFHRVFFNYKKDRIIRTVYPFLKDFKMSFNSYIQHRNNNNHALITNIINSDMVNNLNSKTFLNVYHPNSFNYNTDALIEKDKSTKIFCTNDIDNFDDKLSPLKAFPPKLIQDYISSNKDNNFININYVAKDIKYRNEGEERKLIFKETNGISSSILTGYKKGKKVMTSDLSLEIEERDIIQENTNNHFFNANQLIKSFSSYSFECLEERTYNFPDCKFYGSFRKKAISYLDDNMKIKRRYVVLSFRKGLNTYYYLDVEKDRNDLKKEVLFFININEKLIHKVVYHQVLYGNHRWLSKESFGLIINRDYIVNKHCKTSRKTAFSLIKKLNKI